MTTPTATAHPVVLPSAPPRRRRARVAAGAGRRATLAGYAFVLPGFAIYALVMLYPAVQTLLLSLREWRITPGAESPWVGVDNYVRAFQDPALPTRSSTRSSTPR